MDATNDPGQPPPVSGSGADWSQNRSTPGSALAIGAHPDDVEFGCGGTLAKWAMQGCVIHHLICTDGSKGTWDASADVAALVAQRRDEQREAARRLGGRGEVVFLEQVDGELDSHGPWLRSEVARWIRVLRPDVVLGHDPWKRYRLHPDHRHAGFLTCDAVVAARDPHFFRDHGLDAHRPDALLLWEADTPDHVEDVTATLAAKLHALHAHESQFESTMKAESYAQLSAFDRRVSERLGDLGSPFGFAAAEVFKRITDV